MLSVTIVRGTTGADQPIPCFQLRVLAHSKHVWRLLGLLEQIFGREKNWLLRLLAGIDRLA